MGRLHWRSTCRLTGSGPRSSSSASVISLRDTSSTFETDPAEVVDELHDLVAPMLDRGPTANLPSWHRVSVGGRPVPGWHLHYAPNIGSGRADGDLIRTAHRVECPVFLAMTRISRLLRASAWVGVVP